MGSVWNLHMEPLTGSIIELHSKVQNFLLVHHFKVSKCSISGCTVQGIIISETHFQYQFFLVFIAAHSVRNIWQCFERCTNCLQYLTWFTEVMGSKATIPLVLLFLFFLFCFFLHWFLSKHLWCILPFLCCFSWIFWTMDYRFEYMLMEYMAIMSVSVKHSTMVNWMSSSVNSLLIYMNNTQVFQKPWGDMILILKFACSINGFLWWGLEVTWHSPADYWTEDSIQSYFKITWLYNNTYGFDLCIPCEL